MSLKPVFFLAVGAVLLGCGRPAPAMTSSLRDGTLWLDNRPVLQGVPAGFTAVDDPRAPGSSCA